MKNKKLIIIIICVLVVGLLIGGFILLKNNKTTENTKDLEEEYYNKMYDKMYEYYSEAFEKINVPEDKKNLTLRINLSGLEKKGYSISEFKNYETHEECDLNKSYASRKLVDGEYKIEVFYQCGDKSNYGNDSTITTTTVK